MVKFDIFPTNSNLFNFYLRNLLTFTASHSTTIDHNGALQSEQKYKKRASKQ